MSTALPLVGPWEDDNGVLTTVGGVSADKESVLGVFSTVAGVSADADACRVQGVGAVCIEPKHTRLAVCDGVNLGEVSRRTLR